MLATNAIVVNFYNDLQSLLHVLFNDTREIQESGWNSSNLLPYHLWNLSVLRMKPCVFSLFLTLPVLCVGKECFKLQGYIKKITAPLCEYSNYFSPQLLRLSKLFEKNLFFVTNQRNVTFLILLIICSVLLYENFYALVLNSDFALCLEKQSISSDTHDLL